MSHSICVLCPYGMDAGLVSKAVSLSDGKPVRVLVREEDIDMASAAGASFIHVLKHIPEDENLLLTWLAERILTWDCSIILAPADVRMRNLMPMLAGQLHAGLTADCTDLSFDKDVFLQTRPAFGNNLIASIVATSPLKMATVRPGTFRFIKPNDVPAAIIEEFPNLGTNGSGIDFQPFNSGTPLSQSQIIIAGGLGIGSREGFQKLEQLAQKLGGTVAASRNAVDAGFSSYRTQVGMTGVTVCPKLYIAVGISGAIQHLAGMSASERVIAINSDPKAPIFNYADYGIVADWESVIDKLLEVL